MFAVQDASDFSRNLRIICKMSTLRNVVLRSCRDDAIVSPVVTCQSLFLLTIEGSERLIDARCVFVGCRRSVFSSWSLPRSRR